MADEVMAGPDVSAGGTPKPEADIQQQQEAIVQAPAPEANTKLLDTATANDKRSKKQQGRKRGRGGAPAQEQVALTAAQADHLRIVRVDGRKDPNNDDKTSSVILISKIGKAPQLQLSEDRLTISGTKGFRTARTTHGTYVGSWYCEVTVEHLGETGHVRVGWATKKAELQAPVGFDKFGFCYRDLEGSKVHQGLREPYGEAYGEGDVIGLFIHLPVGGRPCEITDRAVARYKGNLYFVDEPEPEPKPLPGSKIAFTRNGVLQGVAYTDFLEGTYYPAVSLYTLPQQTQAAKVTFNFGPNFKYAPSSVEGCYVAQPMCDIVSFVPPVVNPPPQPDNTAPPPAADTADNNNSAVDSNYNNNDNSNTVVEAAAAIASATIGAPEIPFQPTAVSEAMQPAPLEPTAVVAAEPMDTA